MYPLLSEESETDLIAPEADCDPELFDTTQLPANILAAIEADSFWCLSKLLDGIQDNYISAQPGIHRQVKRMAELVKRIDCEHFESCVQPHVRACLRYHHHRL